MPRRSTVIFAATLALLSTFEPVSCLAEASPEADGKADVERPRFLKREIKRFTFSNITSSISRPFEVDPGEFNHKSSSTSSSLTSSLDTLLTSSSIPSTPAVTSSSSVHSTTPSVPPSTQSPHSTSAKSSPGLPVTSNLPISLPTLSSVTPTHLSISVPSLSLSTPSNPISTPILPSTSSSPTTSRFASPPGDSSTSSSKGQDTKTTPAASTPISSPKSSPAQESTPKSSNTGSGGGQGSSTKNGGIPFTSDLSQVPSIPAATPPDTTRFQPSPSSKSAGQNSSPSSKGGEQGTPSNGGGQSSENSTPTTTQNEGESVMSSMVGGLTKSPSITADVSVPTGVSSPAASVVASTNTRGEGGSGSAGSEPTSPSGTPNKPTSGNGIPTTASISPENSLYNALTSALQTGKPTVVGSTVLPNGETVPVSGLGSVTASLSIGDGTQPSGSALTLGGTVPGSATSGGQVISNLASSVFTSQSVPADNSIPASITVSSSVIPNTAFSAVPTGGTPGLSTLSGGQVVISYGPSTLSNGVVISPGLSTLPSQPVVTSGFGPLPSGGSVSISGLPTSGTLEPTAIPTVFPTGSNSNADTGLPTSTLAPTVIPTIIPTGSNSNVNTGSPASTLESSIVPTVVPTGSNSYVNTGVPVTESPSGTGVLQSSGGSSQETTLPAASSNPSGSSAPVVIGSTTNSKGETVPITSVPPSSQPTGSTGIASASGQSVTASVGGSTTLSNGSVVPISAVSKATESTAAGSTASATGITVTGGSEASTATGVANPLTTPTPFSPSGNVSNSATIPASATAFGATPTASPSLSQSGAVPSSALPIATGPQSYNTKDRTISQTPTGYDTNTAASVGSSIIYATSSSSTTASNDFGPTGLPSGVPLILYPPDGPVKQPPNTDLIQIGFKYPLNYDFVWTHQESQHQIFKFLPMGVAYGLNISTGNCTMQTLRAWDTTQDLHYVTTLALAWIPKDLVTTLGVIIKTPGAPFYNNPNPSVKTLVSMINPAIDIHASDDTDGGSQTVGATPSGTGSTNNGGAPINDSKNAPVRASSVGIGVGVVCGAAAYGAAMFFVARRYKKRRRSHMRSPSMFSSPVMSHAGPDPAAGTALMSGGMGGERSLSPYYDNDGRGSRGSGSSAGRQQISAPVMAENSLGWN